MTDLSDLIERVRAATGPDRAIDRAIMCSIGGWHRLPHSQHGLVFATQYFDGSGATAPLAITLATLLAVQATGAK